MNCLHKYHLDSLITMLPVKGSLEMQQNFLSKVPITIQNKIYSVYIKIYFTYLGNLLAEISIA